MEAIIDTLLQKRRPSVLVIGDVMCDVYIRGQVKRISPEAPVPILECLDRQEFLGGAANVACNLRALGCDVRLVGVVGADAAGQRIRQLLQENDIKDNWLLEDELRPTTEKTRLVAEQQQFIRLDQESRTPLRASIIEQALTTVRELMGEVDGVLCSDYQKGIFSSTFIEPLFSIAHAASQPIVVDPKLNDFSCYRGATVLTPNIKEVEHASGILQTGRPALESAAHVLLEQSQAQALLVTRGKEGMSLFHPPNLPLDIPTQAREVFDVSGAGDTVVATFTMGMFCGLSLEEAAHIANVAAGIVVGKAGTATVSLSEIGTGIETEGRLGDRKIVGEEELCGILELRRVRGERIVFTNGCFDLLHIGHIHLLQQARSRGEVLVVALNDDASVRAMKGNGRPLISQFDRSRILAALTYVDYVTIFSGPTPLSLLKTLRPDILVKGEDYTPDTVVGRDEVESYGGSVHIVPFASDVSTSATINSIVDRFK